MITLNHPEKLIVEVDAYFCAQILFNGHVVRDCYHRGATKLTIDPAAVRNPKTFEKTISHILAYQFEKKGCYEPGTIADMMAAIPDGRLKVTMVQIKNVTVKGFTLALHQVASPCA